MSRSWCGRDPWNWVPVSGGNISVSVCVWATKVILHPVVFVSWLWQSQQPVLESNTVYTRSLNITAPAVPETSWALMVWLRWEQNWSTVLFWSHVWERETLIAWPINQLLACHRSHDRLVNVTTVSEKKLKNCHSTSKTMPGWSTD